MGRRDLATIKPKIQAHNKFLKQHLPMLSLRTRHEWITKRNGYISLDTFARWDRKDNQTIEPQKSDNLEWFCDECHGELRIDTEKGELTCRECGLVHERFQSHDVKHITQIEQYQPTLASSFGHGLGTPTPESTLRWAVKQVRNSPTPKSMKRKEVRSRKARKLGKTNRKRNAAYKEYADVLQLKSYVSGKDRDSKVNAILEHLTKRMRAIHGFDPTSDKDKQFADLDELGKFLRQVRVSLKGYRFSPKRIVDATLVVVYGEKAREVIERPEKRLLCPRCRRERTYAKDPNPEFLLCVKCGKQVLAAEAKFKVSFTPVDSVYVNTILRLMPALPSQLVQSYTTPQVIGQVPVVAI